ncbi:hypothetical protein ALC60_10814 [Trachymyrmex zeteki]|uniref:Endonuclease/exonuclease/phosphatase domain-containing protein n=1 Tax=Mycetomoellerius zeteki TaxID=64791 RepID=A0A151WQN4_9HYME|nr:hypothetical protein ALC60_10814 [Trachymyrmex zeteki]
MIINGKATYVPSRTICIKFAGQSLPKEVVLFSALYKVDAYIPKARICYVGYRIGHIGRNCKSTKPKCLFCGLTKEEDHSCSIDQLHAKCINCEGEHLATSHTCPIIIKHKTILGLAAQDNIPLVEAKKIVASNSSPSLPSHNTLRYFKNFPYLPNHTSYSAPKSYSFPHATPRPPSMTPLVSYNHFQYLDHDDSNDPFSPNPPISYAKLAASSSRRHDQPTVSGSSSGKPSILKIKSVTGKYNILSAPSPNHPTQRTNKSGYSQEHLDLLLVSNGRIDTNYDAKQYHAIKGARDKNPPCPPSRENSTSNAGDFNAYHISWGCFKSDRLVRALLNMVDVNRACIMNDGSPTLLTPPGTNKSVIDITIISADLAPLCETTTELVILGSNHFPINITIGGFSYLRHVFLYKLILDTDKANKLYHCLLSISEEFFSKVPMDSTEAYEYFADHLRNFTRLLFPEKQRFPRSVLTPNEALFFAISLLQFLSWEIWGDY